jgi:hypothetical protein
MADCYCGATYGFVDDDYVERRTPGHTVDDPAVFTAVS